MKVLLLVSTIFAAGISISPAEAAEYWHTSTVKWVYPKADGDFVIAFDTASSGCPSTDNPQYFNVVVGQNDMTAEGAKNVYAAALVALTTRQTVSVAFESVGCYVNRLIVAN